ncbi:MAG: TetR family transcriptional regulator [Acidimicrobiales bacterium]|nr:MAG: TetR family transcriptional regulator [Acidimicrobiales bacterium]
MTRTGRRSDGSDTRADLLTAAQREFYDRGYAGASIRGIAAGAGVDPALVYHYFADKQALFVAALRFPANPAEKLPQVLAGDPKELGIRLVGTVVSVWDSTESSPILTLLRSAVTNPAFADMLREFLIDAVLRPVLDSLVVQQRELRASLVASQLVGLAMARYVLRLPPLTTLGIDDVVQVIAPTVQRYLTGPLGAG